MLTLDKGGSVRFFVNYQNLNSNTVRDIYRTPCMDAYIEIFGNAKIVSIFVASAGYWQIEIDEDSKEITGRLLSLTTGFTDTIEDRLD